RGVECSGDRLALAGQLPAPFEQFDLFTPPFKEQAGLASARCDAVLIAPDSGNFFGRVRRTFLEQAMQQKHIEQPDCGRTDADRAEWIEIHQAHFDVFDAAFAQRMQRTFSGTDDALRPDLAVELVFYLQQT